MAANTAVPALMQNYLSEVASLHNGNSICAYSRMDSQKGKL